MFNRRELLDRADRAGLNLLREVIYGCRPLVDGSPEQAETQGFRFRSPHDRNTATATD